MKKKNQEYLFIIIVANIVGLIYSVNEQMAIATLACIILYNGFNQNK